MRLGKNIGGSGKNTGDMGMINRFKRSRGKNEWRRNISRAFREENSCIGEKYLRLKGGISETQEKMFRLREALGRI